MKNGRIAIPSVNNGGLDGQRSGHFGHCDVFTLVDAQAGVLSPRRYGAGRVGADEHRPVPPHAGDERWRNDRPRVHRRCGQGAA